MRLILTQKETDLFNTIKPYLVRPKIGEMSVIPYRLQENSPTDIVKAREELIRLQENKMTVARSIGDIG